MHNDDVCIADALPEDILIATFEMLPASHRFISPVCRQFRDLLEDTTEKKKKNRTYKYSIVTEGALQQYLEEHGDRGRSSKQLTSYIGAGCGRIDWVERGGVFNMITCSSAAEGGQLGLLKWLRGRGCSWDLDTCWGAAEGGHLKVLQWAREEDCPWHEGTCWGAAKGGHLEILQWARKEGCPWDMMTCIAAAEEGHLETLKFAIRNGCPYKGIHPLSDEIDWDYYDLEDYLEELTDPEFLEWFEEHKTNHPFSSDSEFFGSDFSSDSEFFDYDFSSDSEYSDSD